jgi:hypothetical protein
MHKNHMTPLHLELKPETNLINFPVQIMLKTINSVNFYFVIFSSVITTSHKLGSVLKIVGGAVKNC